MVCVFPFVTTFIYTTALHAFSAADVRSTGWFGMLCSCDSVMRAGVATGMLAIVLSAISFSVDLMADDANEYANAPVMPETIAMAATVP